MMPNVGLEILIAVFVFGTVCVLSTLVAIILTGGFHILLDVSKDKK